MSDCYVRGDDLVAIYQPTKESKITPQVYWRALEAEDERVVGGIELILSVQTEQLDCTPAITTCSLADAEQMLRLSDEISGKFQSIDLSSSPSQTLSPQEGAGLVLFRLARSDFSYAEMIHPADFSWAELECGQQLSRAAKLRFGLFNEHLEKGVIRRARLRGLFLDRQDDEESALACYRQFAASGLPLTA